MQAAGREEGGTPAAEARDVPSWVRLRVRVRVRVRDRVRVMVRVTVTVTVRVRVRVRGRPAIDVRGVPSWACE